MAQRPPRLTGHGRVRRRRRRRLHVRDPRRTVAPARPRVARHPGGGGSTTTDRQPRPSPTERLQPATRITWFPPTARPAVVSSPTADGELSPLGVLRLTFADPVRKAIGDKLPTLTPKSHGTFSRPHAHTLVFTPLGQRVRGRHGRRAPHAAEGGRARVRLGRGHADHATNQLDGAASLDAAPPAAAGRGRDAAGRRKAAVRCCAHERRAGGRVGRRARRRLHVALRAHHLPLSGATAGHLPAQPDPPPPGHYVPGHAPPHRGPASPARTSGASW